MITEILRVFENINERLYLEWEKERRNELQCQVSSWNERRKRNDIGSEKVHDNFLNKNEDLQCIEFALTKERRSNLVCLLWCHCYHTICIENPKTPSSQRSGWTASQLRLIKLVTISSWHYRSYGIRLRIDRSMSFRGQKVACGTMQHFCQILMYEFKSGRGSAKSARDFGAVQGK
ncbi:hypothetical protein RB195_015145 [Necator americanus]|uniref:Uncharacterized protein n=1 Tax=Necator americanus TaxID=51031 RepID=A0ABR1E389_NECAM